MTVSLTLDSLNGQHLLATATSTLHATMTPILYGHRQSPFVRSVEMVLDILNVKYEFKFVVLFKGEHKKPEYLKVWLIFLCIMLSI